MPARAPAAEPARHVGPYALDRALARGPRLELWEAHLIDSGQRVLLYWAPDDAVVPWTSVADPIQALSRVARPSLRPILLAGPIDGGWAVAYAWRDGVSLPDLLGRLERERRPLSPAIVLHVGVELAAGLAAGLAVSTPDGLSLSVTHGHLSPRDVWLTPEGDVLLTGLGLPPVEEHETAALPFPIRGVPEYLAPEQVRGGPVTPRTDVFALGAILHETAQLTPLFAAEVVEDALRAVLERPIPVLSETILGFPVQLARVIKRALARSPEERPGSAHEFGRALGELGSTVAGTSEARATLAFLVARARSRSPDQRLISALIAPDPRAHGLAATEVAEAREPLGEGLHKLPTEAAIVARGPSREGTFDDPTISVDEPPPPERRVAPDPATGERVRIAARGPVVPTQITADGFVRWLEKNKTLVFSTLGTLIVILAGALWVTRRDPQADARLEALFEQRAWSEVERFYVQHQDEFRLRDRAFELASEARAERLGWRSAPRVVAPVKTSTAAAPPARAAPVELPTPDAFPEPDAVSRADKKHRARIRKIVQGALRALQDGDLVEAEHALRRCVELESNAACHFHLAQVYRRLGSAPLAAEQLRRYLEVWPGAPDAERVRAAIAEGR